MPRQLSMTEANASPQLTPDSPNENEFGASLRNGRVLILLFVGLAIVFVYGYIQRANAAAEVQSQIQEMEQRIAAAHERRALLEGELRYVASDDFLDKIAREELGLAQPGETALVILEPPAPQALTATDGEQSPDTVTTLPASAGELPAGEQAPALPFQSSSASFHQTDTRTPAPSIWQAWLDLFSPSARP